MITSLITSLTADWTLLGVVISIALMAYLLKEQSNRILEMGAATSLLLALSTTGLMEPILQGNVAAVLYLISFLIIQPYTLVTAGTLNIPIPVGISNIDLFLMIPLTVLIYYKRKKIKDFYTQKILQGLSKHQQTAFANLLLLLTIPAAIIAYKMLAYGGMILLDPMVPVETEMILTGDQTVQPLFMLSGALSGIRVSKWLRARHLTDAARVAS